MILETVCECVYDSCLQVDHISLRVCREHLLARASCAVLRAAACHPRGCELPARDHVATSALLIMHGLLISYFCFTVNYSMQSWSLHQAGSWVPEIDSSPEVFWKIDRTIAACAVEPHLNRTVFEPNFGMAQVCLAVWDFHMEFPKRAAQRRGEDACCSCTLCPCGCCDCCLDRRSKHKNDGGQTLRIVQGGQEPRALEFMQVSIYSTLV